MLSLVNIFRGEILWLSQRRCHRSDYIKGDKMKKILLILSVMIFGVVSATATDNNYTPSGTDISNYGTLSFKVGNVVQAEQNSTTDTFKVDRKIDVVVVSQDNDKNVTVSPNQKGAFMTFLVRNDGNAHQDFAVSAIATDESGDDTNDTENIRVYVDTNNDGTYSSADTDTLVSDLAPDTNISVFIVVDVPSDLIDGDVAEYSLLASVHEVGAAAITTDHKGTDDGKNTIEDVFADADGDTGGNDDPKNGKHIDYERFVIKAAVLSFAKWSIVVEDPINGKKVDGNHPKRIPDATIRYCFELNNTGTTAATNLSWEDNVTSELTVTKAKYADPVDAIDCECKAQETKALTTPLSNNLTFPTDTTTLTVGPGKTVCAYIEATIN